MARDVQNVCTVFIISDLIFCSCASSKSAIWLFSSVIHFCASVELVTFGAFLWGRLKLDVDCCLLLSSSVSRFFISLLSFPDLLRL